jgi:predicted aspartyl protease
LGLTRNDIVGVIPVIGVNGQSEDPVVLMRQINIGGLVPRNARAVGEYTLLGQAFLGKLGTYTIDNSRGLLVLNG